MSEKPLFLSNKLLSKILLAASALLLIRVFYAALVYNNWRGFFYTAIHIIAVAIFTYIALKSAKS